jgi:hypothetical protein
MDDVLDGEAGRTVCCVDEDTFRVGDKGDSGVAVVPRVVSHGGGLLAESLRAIFGNGECVGVGVSPAGFRGELVGVATAPFNGELVGVAADGFKGELEGVAADGVGPECLKGELVGVVGLPAEGDCASWLGRRNGDVRGLLKLSGESL